MFVGASAQITGTSHEALGTPCQDRAVSWSSDDGELGIIVLCDGAGSCSSSEIGAEILCDWFPKWVVSRTDWWSLSSAEIPEVLVPEMRARLEMEAKTRGVTFRSLSSTFLAVTAIREAGWVAYRILHLGDGIAACIGQDAQIVLSEPENAEFANETVFTTSSSAQKSFRVIEGTAQKGSGFVLMSDGSATSLYLKAKKTLAPAVAEVIVWLNDHDEETVSQALESNGKELFTQKTGDDCSIALLLDRDPENRFSVTLEHPQPAKYMTSHPVKSPRKLIEVALPLDAINAACAREKSIRHGHPSTLHLWWARRPLAAARAVIFAQLVNDPGYQQGGGFKYGMNKKDAAKERKRLFKIIEDLVLWENTTNEEVLEKARAEIRRSWREVCELNKDHPDAAELFNPDKMPGLHDPFAGGGAIPLEAQRLGLEAYASDLNPVAVLINKAMIEIPPKFAGRPPVNPEARKRIGGSSGSWPGATGLAEDVRYYGKWMRDEAEKRIGHLYPKVEITAEMAKERPDLKPLVGQKLTVIAWLWARTVKSPHPAFSHVDVPLLTTYILSAKQGSEKYLLPVRSGDNYTFRIVQEKPLGDPSLGTKSEGSGANFHCLLSNVVIDGKYIKCEAQSGRMGTRLLACVADGPKGRVYLPSSEEMEFIAASANPTWKPETTFFQKALGFRVGNYGMTKWSDLFTKRQTHMLVTLCDLVIECRRKIESDLSLLSNTERNVYGTTFAHYADAICVYLTLSISRISQYWSSLTSWHNKGEKLQPVFGRQAVPMIWDFCEGNPFSESTGNFMGSVMWVQKSISCLPATTISHATYANACTQSISRNMIVSTDPPYYDNIGYADLSDFFYSWIRRALRQIDSQATAAIAAPKDDELVATPARHGGKKEAESFFLSGMSQAMHNLACLCHPSFPVSIYYAFKQSDTKSDGTSSTGWSTFLTAVVGSGFSISGTWPMRTEMKGRVRDRGNSNALASSIVLVCRKRPSDAETIPRRQFLRELNEVLPEALDEMTRGSGDDRSPVAPVDLSQAIIGPGMAVFSKYSAVLEADGSPMTVRTALQLINRFLAEDDFDADTQFCLHWFEQYGWKSGPFGEADVLARAKATSVDGVKQAGVVESGDGKVRLLKWAEYPTDWDPRGDVRLPVWETLHHLIRAQNQGGDTAAGTLLAATRSQTEAARQLAYRLYTLCERQGWAEDARAYNELITGWTGIESAAAAAPAQQRQGELFE
jgi:putative DNA methylase